MSRDLGDEKSEIVIVRRRAADDGGGGKAGAWKIAYADFVTAMMAFFLVMWLINASNEETRAQVASYFNPIKLTDSSTGARSIKDMKDTRNPQHRLTGETAEGSPPSKTDVNEEANMLANPPRSLDKIAKTVSESEYRNAGLESNVEIAPSLKPDKNNPGVGDPFDPRSWDKAASEGDAKLDPMKEKQSAIEQDDTSEEGSRDTPSLAAERTAATITREIADHLGKTQQQLSPDIEVKADGHGVLINLTANADFEMFKTGSAEPEPRMLKLMEVLAASLKLRGSNIVVRGHTDSRPYRSKYYDNWQLSTARANLARYMLIRGGVEAIRIRRVEGVADLEPKNAADPQAPENRRIEIFIGGDRQ